MSNEAPRLRRIPSTVYMSDRLSDQVKSMTDAVLVVQACELPVHMYILAANSPVFAEMLGTAAAQTITQPVASSDREAPQGARSLPRVPLQGDSLQVVCTALKYLYLETCVVSPGEPEIQSCEDAAALVTFAHKYAMSPLLQKAEERLVEEAANLESWPRGSSLFGDPTQLVAWVMLAETCELDAFLAHAELYMIKNVDTSFWQGALTAGSGGISQQCFLLVLRGALYGRQHARKFLDVLHQHHCNCAGYDNDDVPLDSAIHGDCDVTIAILRKWHREEF